MAPAYPQLRVARRQSIAPERASAAADFINQRFGAGTIQFGINQPHPGFLRGVKECS